MTQILLSAGSTGLLGASLNTTTYFALGTGYFGEATPTGTEANINITWRAAGTFSNAYVRITSNAISTNSTLNFRKNAANGNQTITITASTTGEFTDSVNTDTVVATDKLDIQCVAGTAGTSLSFGAFNILFSDTTTANTSGRLIAGQAVTPGSINTFYQPICGRLESGANSNTEANIQFKNKASATWQNLFTIVTISNTGTQTLKSRKNTANGNQSISITTTGTFEDNTNTDSLVSGDLIDYAITLTSANWRFVVIASEYLSTNGNSLFASADSTGTGAISTSTTRYTNIAGSLASTGITATESVAQSKALVAFTASNLECLVFANTVTAASTINFRKNAGNGNQTISITASTTGYFEDTTHSDSIASTDEINYQIVTGATGTTLTLTNTGILAAYGAAGNVATWSAHSSFSAVGSALNSQPATWSPKSTFSPHGVAAKQTVATWSAHASLSAVGVAAANSVATWSAHASFSSISSSLGKGVATWSSHSTLSAIGKGIGNSTATWSAHASLSFTSASLGKGKATWSANASFSPISASLGRGTATFSPHATFNAVGTHTGGGSKAIFSAIASFSAISANLAKSVLTINASTSVVFVGQSQGSGAGGISAVPARGVGTIPPGLSMAHGMSSRKGMSGSIYRS